MVLTLLAPRSLLPEVFVEEVGLLLLPAALPVSVLVSLALVAIELLRPKVIFVALLGPLVPLAPLLLAFSAIAPACVILDPFVRVTEDLIRCGHLFE